MHEGPTFRTTETMLFTECSMKWALRKQGLVSKVVGAKDVASCLGTAFHAGAAHLVLHPAEVELATELAKASLIEGASQLYDGSRVIKPETEAELDALPIRLMNAIKCLASNLHLLDKYEVLATELTLPSAGSTTIDVVLREKRTGWLGILDWKTKVFQRPYYRTQYIKDMETSWQLRHYAWGYSQHSGEDVGFYVVGLMDLTGKATLDLIEYDVNKRDLDNWYASATQHWQDMQDIVEGEREPAQIADCRTRYGVCEYFNMCHLHQYRDSARVEYLQLEV